MRSSFSLSLLYHAYVYLEFLILACTIYILAAVLSGMEDRTERSSCLRVSTYAAIHKIVSDYSLDKMLGQFFSERDMALLLDLASYSIVEESNVAQHYPDYAYNHPLYSSGTVSYTHLTLPTKA